jgi:hypothetical protein
MRRNRAFEGPRNFDPSNKSKIAEDGRYALSYANKLLGMAKSDVSKESMRFHENEFASAKSIESLFMVEKLLFNVRTEKNIDDIILLATNTLGYSLTTRNRVWGAMVSFWCNHVLWRCFVCKGDIEIANTFKANSETLIEYLNSSFEIIMSGFEKENKYNIYDNTKGMAHYITLKNIINLEKIPTYTNKEKTENTKEDNLDIFCSRKVFYEEFIGFTEGRRWHRKTKGNKIDLFSQPQRNLDWEDRIKHIPKYMEGVLDYLEKSSTIVAIPTTRLVIIDLLLLFSRISVQLNPNEVNPKQGIDEGQRVQIAQKWNKVVKPSLESMNKHIKKTRTQLTMYVGKERLHDFDYIINKLGEISIGGNIMSDFNIGSDRKVKITTSRNAGVKIQELLKELISKDRRVDLQFPILVRGRE